MFKIQLQGVPVILAVSGIQSVNPNEALTLTFTLTTQDGGISVKGVDIFIYENSALLDSVETNAEGKATYAYSTSIEGEHSLEIVTYKFFINYKKQFKLHSKKDYSGFRVCNSLDINLKRFI